MAIEWTPIKVTVFWIVVETLMLAAVSFGFYAVIHQSGSTTLVDVPTTESDSSVSPTSESDGGSTGEAEKTEEEDNKLIDTLTLDIESLIRIQRQSRTFGIIALVFYALAFLLGSVVARALRIPFPS